MPNNSQTGTVTHSVGGSSLVWEVRLPDKRAVRSSWGSRPRGVLSIDTPTHGGESLSIPMQVARILSSKQRSGELAPASRSELLYALGELCRACARTRVERLIDRREYSREEVRAKLRQDGYAEATIEECLARACEVGLISDARFADSFIRTKLSAGWGMSRIERELSRRGVEAKDLDGWPYEYLDPADELSRALEAARRKGVRGARPYERLVRHLCGKGFATGVAMQAARQVVSEQPEQDRLVDF